MPPRVDPSLSIACPPLLLMTQQGPNLLPMLMLNPLNPVPLVMGIRSGRVRLWTRLIDVTMAHFPFRQLLTPRVPAGDLITISPAVTFIFHAPCEIYDALGATTSTNYA